MGRRPIPWVDVIRELREQPGMWVLHPSLCQRSPKTVSNVNRRMSPRAVRIPDGKIQAKHGWVGRTADGREIADIYLRYRPHQEGVTNDEENQ